MTEQNDGSGTPTGTTPGQDPAAAGPQAQPQDAGEGGKGAGSDPQPDKQFTQADVDRIIKERLEREKKKAEEAAAKAKAKAEEEALAKNQEFQKLAEKRLKKVEELEGQLAQVAAVEEQLKAANKALETFRDQLIAQVPESVQLLLEGQDLPAQLQWLAEHAQDYAGDAQDANGSGGRFPSSPKKGKEPTLSPEEARKKAYFPRL